MLGFLRGKDLILNTSNARLNLIAMLVAIAGNVLETYDSGVFVCNAGRTADPLSPVGTAFSFNRPKRQAAEIANTSLILQFASARFVNSFLQG